MPLQNRVTPDGDIIATDARGTFMGNRGILHDEHRRIVRTHRNRMWLICLLDFNGRRRTVMSPGSYTELFFLDEAVALAAGHRPCAECRRPAFRAYLDAVRADHGEIEFARDLDRALNHSRRAAAVAAPIDSLPDGAFIAFGDSDFRLLWHGALHRWSPEGYTDPVTIAEIGDTAGPVLTPPLTVAALRRGYPVQVHPSALR